MHAGHLLAGALAGAVSRTATAPLETLRLAAMAGSLPAGGGSLLGSLRQLAGSHGWRALYKGNLVNVARSAPQKALDFFAFDMWVPGEGCAGGGQGGRPPTACVSVS
jgi:solute carrier family 25 phosphate transporter 23/24/25/41